MSLFDRKPSLKRQLLIEDRGASRLSRLSHVATSKSTTHRVLELAWTAGPVTLVASIGGYYLGHGKSLPKETLVFFIAYTIITGVIGLAAHMINRLGRGRREEEVTEQLVRVMGTLPDLVLGLRDLRLEALDPDQRKLEAARILLQDVDLGPLWLASAVRSIGGSAGLAEAVSEIELFRRAGMLSRGRDILQQHHQELTLLVASLRQHSAALGNSLEARFLGVSYDKRAGVVRGRYFIERIFAAIDDDDDLLMTLEDAEDIYTLLFELLCGRRIPMLAFSFAGGSRLARETEALEERRLQFRIVRARAYSRLLALASYLSDSIDSGNLTHSWLFSSPLTSERLNNCAQISPAGLTGPELLIFCTTHIETLVAQVKADTACRKTLIPILSQALALYGQAYMAYRRTERDYLDFLKTVERWKRRLASYPETEVFFSATRGGRGLQITEDSIVLSDKGKVRVVKALLERFQLQPDISEPTDKRVGAAKQLAIRVALALDEEIQIRRPEVQRAIYNANTLNMGVFERDLSTTSKIGWGEALVKEIEKDMRSASIALVAAIYRFYGLRLDPESQLQLALRYGATVEQLEQQCGEESGEAGSAVSDYSRLPSRPFPVAKPPLAWRLALARCS